MVYTVVRSNIELYNGLEGEVTSILLVAKHIDDSLTHEQSNRDTNRNRYHSVTDSNTIPLGGNPSRFGKTRLREKGQDEETAIVR